MKKLINQGYEGESMERGKSTVTLPFWKMQASMIVGHYLALASQRTSTDSNGN